MFIIKNINTVKGNKYFKANFQRVGGRCKPTLVLKGIPPWSGV